MKNIMIWGVHPDSHSGLGKVTRCFSEALQNLGYRVYVIAYDGQWEKQGSSNDGKQVVINYRKEHQDNFKQNVRNLKPEYIISIGDVWKCEPVYHIQAATGVKWLAYVGSEGDTYPKYASFRDASGGNKAFDIDESWSGVSTIIAYTTHTREVLAHQVDSITVLPHCVDVDVINKAEPFPLRKILGISKSKKLLLFIGDNVYRKGLDIFCKIMAYYPDYCAYMHTPLKRDHGVNLHELKHIYGLNNRLATIEDLNNKMKRTEYSDTDIYGMYKDADLFFHPHRAEGFGLCIMEALHAGIPVLATNCSGPSTYLPRNAQIDVKELEYIQAGGVGYNGHTPNVIVKQIKKHFSVKHIAPKGYTKKDFQNGIEQILKMDHPKRFWKRQ